jgi:hypothetical protein
VTVTASPALILDATIDAIADRLVLAAVSDAGNTLAATGYVSSYLNVPSGVGTANIVGSRYEDSVLREDTFRTATDWRAVPRVAHHK